MNISELRSEDSLEKVKYLGKIPSLYSHGIGVAIEPVRTIWKRSKKGTLYNRCALSVDRMGLSVYEEIANGTYKGVWCDPLENISYCVAEPLHPRIFAWISRSVFSNELECHAVLCKTSKQAGLLAESLSRLFYEFYYYQQKRMHELTPSLSTRCSVCDTIARRQQNVLNLPIYRNQSLYRNNKNVFDQQQPQSQQHDIADYEPNSLQEPMIARAFVRNYEDNSIHSSSHFSTDYDSILSDKKPYKPLEYYRR